jgi:hypothetical protein
MWFKRTLILTCGEAEVIAVGFVGVYLLLNII